MYSRWILCDFHAAQSKYIAVIARWGLCLGCQGKKGSPKLSINHWQTGLFLTCRCFKLTNSPCIFERHTVTSPTTLVSKGRHCHWDFANRRLKDYQPTSDDHYSATCRCRESNPDCSSCKRGPLRYLWSKRQKRLLLWTSRYSYFFFQAIF